MSIDSSARTARGTVLRTTLVPDDAATSISSYLIRRIEENPAIDLRTCTEIVSLEGDKHLERVA